MCRRASHARTDAPHSRLLTPARTTLLHSPDRRGRGVTGSRAGFRSLFREECGFESHRPHVIVDIQYSAGANDWPVLRDAVRRAEDEGYGTTWVLDHFDGAMVGGDRPMLEAFTLLGALAACTTRDRSRHAGRQREQPPAGAARARRQQRAADQRRPDDRSASVPAARRARSGRASTTSAASRCTPTMADRHRELIAQIPLLRAASDAPIIVGAASVELATLAGELADGVNVRMTHPEDRADHRGRPPGGRGPPVRPQRLGVPRRPHGPRAGRGLWDSTG